MHIDSVSQLMYGFLRIKDIKMFKVVYSIFKDFGLDAVQLCIICFFGWKIVSNHLHHIQESLDKLFKKTEDLEKEVIDQGNRVSKIEGKLD